MTDSSVEVAETKAVTETPPPHPKQKSAVKRTGDQRVASVLAKKKQRRAAHRVALRRSNTGG